MADELFPGRTEITATALYVGDRIDTKPLLRTDRLADFPLLIRAGERGAAALFRYGAVVLFDHGPLEQASFLAHLGPFVTSPFENPATEGTVLRLDAREERADPDGIRLKDFGVPRLLAVADVLAKSAALAHYEATIAATFDRIEPLAASLQRGGKGRRAGRELLNHIGSALLAEHKTVGRVEVEEKPEFLWDHPEVDRLYVRLEDEYELTERHRALGRKLNLISRTAETLLQLAHEGRSLRVEWYIVLLIVIDILLSLYDKYVAGP